ncbi:MAG: hypothetical protein COS49_00300 [Candidatus Portnoybacteria bacterium CG03_land_8_20_14_0_80_41_10]|uniref:Uncharacterized protein n=1 Tax=Candidatus Portnoybacteria bacterium CG03_land_8_20_14_0_80_41_10 TaxID=1974808 RepID=A0A2M7BV92_9BACT|nr:MAG: hypothetical protein COS49_00300 [Candidatus Portnoybacteria bacterium CG03_land_8_20_14_0_80_41_10]
MSIVYAFLDIFLVIVAAIIFLMLLIHGIFLLHRAIKFSLYWDTGILADIGRCIKGILFFVIGLTGLITALAYFLWFL